MSCCCTYILASLNRVLGHIHACWECVGEFASVAQAWAYVFPVSLLRIPYSLTVAVFWSLIVYYPVGLAPDPATCATCRATFLCSRPHGNALLLDVLLLRR